LEGPPPGELPAGEGTPFGKYLLRREVARGGMGVVYDAIDTTLGRRVALKMLVTDPRLGPEEAAQDEQRFLREAKLAANIPKHPHIVGVYEAGVLEGKRYLAMEFVEGLELSEWRRRGRVSIPTQVRVLRDAALAVHHAHEHGVLHRDLKPQNILIDRDGKPHITDFGLARSLQAGSAARLTAPNIALGTPVYMSPEQAQGKRSVDRRGDVYSLGVMLYEILAGKPPFQGDNPLEVMTKKVTGEVPRPSSVRRLAVRPGLDRTIEAICLKALSREPEGRYPTARDFAEDLTRWLEGQKVQAVPAGRKRLLVGLAAGAGLLVLGALVWIALRPRPPEPAPVPPAPVPAPSAPAPPTPPAPPRVPVRVEAEDARVLLCTGGRTARQRAGSSWKGTWSAGGQLFWTAGKPGDRLRLAVPAGEVGRGTLAVALATAKDYGIFRISFNGRVLETALDLYSPKVVHLGEKVYEGVEIRAGENEIEFEILGSNPKARPDSASSTLHQLGIDYVELR